MPLTPEEPQIYESVPGPRSAAGTTRTPQASGPAAPVPGPRASSRPASAGEGGKSSASGQSGAAGTEVPPQRPAPAAKKAPAAEIELVPAADATAVEAADDSVDKLLDNGRAPGEILLLTTGEQHPWAQHELSFGEDAYWRQLEDGGDVFSAHVSEMNRVSGRPVVVLAVNGGSDAEVAEALPAAMARASVQLVVCGDPQRLSTLL